MRQMAEYIQRAEEAEAQANKLKDEAAKAQWREIANAYRNLAQARLTSLETASTQPSPLPASQNSPRT